MTRGSAFFISAVDLEATPKPDERGIFSGIDEGERIELKETHLMGHHSLRVRQLLGIAVCSLWSFPGQISSHDFHTKTVARHSVWSTLCTEHRELDKLMLWFATEIYWILWTFQSKFPQRQDYQDWDSRPILASSLTCSRLSSWAHGNSRCHLDDRSAILHLDQCWN